MNTPVPRNAFSLMAAVYGRIFPEVHKELEGWITQAQAIPDQELRTQALSSIETKTFHCEGGGIYALLAGENWRTAIRFIVAYQTISDYLDNLCDRSTSMDPQDFRMLHEAMTDALTPGNQLKNYYQFRSEQNDGGYLEQLVTTCQDALDSVPDYEVAGGFARKLGGLYNDLQVHKHVFEEERIPRLQNWFASHQAEWPELKWYEFSACTGSTLGIFCLVSYTLSGEMSSDLAEKIARSYFPFMQGLHIMLDYYIDQMEDEAEGDLNFCSYYDHEEEMKQRFIYFVEQARSHVQLLPNPKFHEMIREGLVGMYLADRKVAHLENAQHFAKALLRASGRKAKFFYFNTKMYHKMKPERSL
ncbi:tetraprenyl-beta-curcumene synthase family protein [Thalassobacillus sp. CUG 92003]|uniref:tetraprenyl-beta-curcumene synthase family protein n=1 Tax=Thalassobacillus sp. CUG 92003 TaxID=2736641 RepID=UPI00272C215E|nr:tetraprenyl-beta-curcumene synthase family protein [Thalassobacillus sp. CUG 92003]